MSYMRISGARSVRVLTQGLVAVALLLGCSRAAPERRADSPESHETRSLEPVAAQAAPAEAPRAEIAPAEPSLFLWKVQSAAATVHLLGSIHVATKAIYPLKPRVEQAFTASDTLVLELDLSPASQADAAQLMVQAALLPKGENVFEHLSAPTQDLLRQKLQSLSVEPSQISAFKPWFVGLTLAMLEIERAGYSSDFGIDRHFYERAEGSKRLLALETAEQQLAAFSALEESGDSQSLLLSLEIDSAKQMREMLALWERGDVAGLDQLLEESRAYPKAFQAMFTDRNQRMAKQIIEYLKTENRYFVVVGAGHLVGEDSIVDLLEEQGFVVERK